MALVPKTYNRNLRAPKFYSTVNSGHEEYNADITLFFNSNDEILRVEEVWRGVRWTQTISGSNYLNQTVDYSVLYSAWEETTVS